MAGVSMERGLLDMPCEILFEIYRRIPKLKLIDISKLCSKLRDAAEDTRFWKHVYIDHRCSGSTYFAFEELYSEPWPVEMINMKQLKIAPPVSSKIDQVVKAKILDLSAIEANNVTLEAILAKYQCTELYLDFNNVDSQGRIKGISPETFSEQTALEVLSLRNMTFDGQPINSWLRNLRFIDVLVEIPCSVWLAPVLDNCKNLKALYLSETLMKNSDMMTFIKNLPSSLEKLFLGHLARPEDSFFEYLAEKTPNLKELELCPTRVKYPSLLEFQFLEVLRLVPRNYQDISDLYMYLIKFPALRTVYIQIDEMKYETSTEKLKTTLEPHGITVELVCYPYLWSYPDDDNLLKLVKRDLISMFT